MIINNLTPDDFNEYFSNIGNNLSNNITNDNTTNKNIFSTMTNQNINSIYFYPTTQFEIENIIANSKNKFLWILICFY